MKTLDDLANELQPTVNRLLDGGLVQAAAELVWSYRDEAARALWKAQLEELVAEDCEPELPCSGLPEITVEAVDVPAPLKGLDVLIPPKVKEAGNGDAC